MKNLKNLILEPSRLFKSLKEKPNWLIPFIIVSILGIVFALLMQPASAQVSIAKLQETLTSGQIEQAMQTAKRLGWISISLLPLITLIRWSIISALFLTLSNLFTDKMNFKKTFSIVSYCNIILALGMGVNVGTIYLRGLDTVSSPHDLWLIGLNFWSPETLGLPMSLFLSEITVFSVWYVVLITLGLKIVADLSKWKAVFISVFVWLLSVGFKVGLALLGTQFSPMR